MRDINTRQFPDRPLGFWVLCFAEFWDRFTYYGIVSILVLYLAKSLFFSESRLYALYGVYTTLAFSVPVIGGWLADRWLGYPTAILYGLGCMLLGTLILSFDPYGIYVGLTIVIIGIGLFKPNNATFFGKLFNKQKSDADRSYNLLYMGMNIGAITGPVFYGITAISEGWHAGFVLSSIGIFISVGFIGWRFQFSSFYRNFLTAQWQKTFKHLLSKRSWLFHSILVLSIMSISLLFRYPIFFDNSLWLITLVTLTIFFMIAKRQSHLEIRRSMTALLILDVFAIFYFTCQVQIGSSLLLFINHYLPEKIGPWQVPTEAYLSLEPLFVILLAPVVSTQLWQTFLKTLHRGNTQHLVTTEVALGLFAASLSFLVFALSAYLSQWHHAIFLFLLILAGNLLLGLGELLASPTLLAAVNRFAPDIMKSRLMGMWALAIAFGGNLGSLLNEVALKIQPTVIQSYHFMIIFLTTAMVVFMASLVAFALSPWLRRLLPSPTQS